MITADQVFTAVASLLNDQLQVVFTDEVQTPYLNMALKDLGLKLQLNDIPVALETSAVIAVAANENNIGGPDVGDPNLPTGFMNAKQLWQRPTGTTNVFLPITQYQFLPKVWDGLDTANWICGWAYLQQYIHLIPSSTPMDVKIDYVKNIIAPIVDPTDEIDINNVDQYLTFRTAAYCAYFIGENETRATALNGSAEIAFNEAMGIEVKGQQSIGTRRRPFRSAWRNRGIV